MSIPRHTISKWQLNAWFRWMYSQSTWSIMNIQWKPASFPCEMTTVLTTYVQEHKDSGDSMTYIHWILSPRPVYYLYWVVNEYLLNESLNDWIPLGLFSRSSWLTRKYKICAHKYVHFCILYVSQKDFHMYKGNMCKNIDCKIVIAKIRNNFNICQHKQGKVHSSL